MSLGARIRHARNDAGLSQAALGDALGVPQSNVSQWESDVREPSVTRLVTIADVLKVSLDWLAMREKNGVA